MIYRTSPEQIANYFADESVSQSQLKLVAKGIDLYLANKDKLSTDKYYDEPADHFIIGSAVDCKITEGLEVYGQKYKISTLTSKPSETLISIIRYVFDKVVEHEIPANPDGTLTINGTTVFPLSFYSTYILEACERENYQPRYGNDAKINAVTKDTGDYWNEMIDSVGMQILTLEQSVLINRIVDSFGSFLYIYSNHPDIDIFFQFPLFDNMRSKNGSFIGCKGLIDMVIVNHTDSTITIVDFKTMGDSVINFNSHMKKRRYDIQIAFYYNLFKRIEERNLVDYMLRKYPTLDVAKYSEVAVYDLKNPEFWVQSTIYDNNPVKYIVESSVLTIGRLGREAGYIPLSLVSGNITTLYSEKIFGYMELLDMYLTFMRSSTKHPVEINLTWDNLS